MGYASYFENIGEKVASVESRLHEEMRSDEPLDGPFLEKRKWILQTCCELGAIVADVRKHLDLLTDPELEQMNLVYEYETLIETLKDRQSDIKLLEVKNEDSKRRLADIKKRSKQDRKELERANRKLQQELESANRKIKDLEEEIRITRDPEEKKKLYNEYL